LSAATGAAAAGCLPSVTAACAGVAS
jgi:hypothetical protein